MKFIRTGLTNSNFTSLLHDLVWVSSLGGLSITGYRLNNEPVFSFVCDQPVLVKAKFNSLAITQHDISNHVSLLIVKAQSQQGKIIVSTDKQMAHERIYDGELLIIAQGNKIRLVLNCSLEEYVKSVLKAEIPASYHLEAIKAQAVAVRTYALHPRVNHEQDLCNVCDSYLCCQGFSGWQARQNPIYIEACAETAGQILTYKDTPILALFSSCAGGHTENYEDCFSDLRTGKFPPQPLPYLRGVSESTQAVMDNQSVDESVLKKLWQSRNVFTVDAWASRFRWSFHFSTQDLEATMHHVLSQLLVKKELAPFIVSPPSEVFGCIQSFSIDKRGVGGTAINLIVATSKGNWQFTKELTIRSLFKNKSINLERLPSARVFFDEHRDDKKQLLSITVYGLGNGHGVGMQQVGAEGWARQKKNYQEILNHYYVSAQIDKI